jgi:hypothetical protein
VGLIGVLRRLNYTEKVVTTGGNCMRWMLATLLTLVFVSSLSSCLSLGKGNRGDSYQQAVRKEFIELVKSYRLCLQKYEEHPAKAKENCGTYREAIHELVPPYERRSIAEMLERLLERGL